MDKVSKAYEKAVRMRGDYSSERIYSVGMMLP